MVLSAILAQSLMMQNFPCKEQNASNKRRRTDGTAYNDTVLSYLDVIPDGGGFNDGTCPDVDVITNLHRVVIEVSTIGLVWRSERV
jgi:hypothetical protein